jgi:hypothetical protein
VLISRPCFAARSRSCSSTLAGTVIVMTRIYPQGAGCSRSPLPATRVPSPPATRRRTRRADPAHEATVF